MLILSASDVKQAMGMNDCINAVKHGFTEFSAGNIQCPIRTKIDSKNRSGSFLVMPCCGVSGGAERIVVKNVSVFPENQEKGLSTVCASVMLFDGTNGEQLALIEGKTLTAMRTGAGSGLATDLLAAKDAKSVAIIGSGVQAKTQLEAVCTVRNISKVKVYSPHPEHVKRFAKEMSGINNVPELIIKAGSAKEAVRDADIICTATDSYTAVFDHSDIKPVCHINAVGAYMPEMQEIPEETVLNADLYVDSRESAFSEPGDIMIPLSRATISEDHIIAEIGEVAAGNAKNVSRKGITLFKSVGIAAQDLFSADMAYRYAVSHGIGTEIL